MPHIHIVRDPSREDLLLEIERKSHEQERMKRELDAVKARLSNIQLFGLAVCLLVCVGGLWFMDKGYSNAALVVALCAGPWSFMMLIDFRAEAKARRNF